MRCTPLKPVLIIMAIAAVALSCSKKNDTGTGLFTIAYSNLKLSSGNIVPVLDASIHGHGYALLDILSDSVLYYDIYCDTVPSGDAPVSFSLYFGLSGGNGTLIQTVPLTLNSNGEAIASVKLPASVIDSFINYASLYIVVNSNAYPNGLMRAQISHNGVIGSIDKMHEKPDMCIRKKTVGNQDFDNGDFFFYLPDWLVFTDKKGLILKPDKGLDIRKHQTTAEILIPIIKA